MTAKWPCDGVYQVRRDGICAGFTVKDGEVIACAPVLRKKFSYWFQYAIWIGEIQGEQDVTTKGVCDT